MKMTHTDRLFLALTGILAAWQVAIGIEGLETIPVAAYTIAFGTFLVATLLLMILGFDALESPIVVSISSLIPLSLSLGLVWQHLEAWRGPYAAFAIPGLLAVIITRALPMPGRTPALVTAVVHGIAGMVIFLLPTARAALAQASPGFALVGLGGGMIGLGGLLLSFLKAGKPILPRQTILKILPALFLLTTAAFVAGFALA